jgi:hypothetical protein
MDTLKLLYDLFGAPYPRGSIVIVAMIGACLFGTAWWFIGKRYEADHLTRQPSLHSSSEPASVSSDATVVPGHVAAGSQVRSIQANPSEKAASAILTLNATDPQEELRRLNQRLIAMYANAKALTLSIDRDAALIRIINVAWAENRPELANTYIADLSLGIDRDTQYKRLLDALIAKHDFSRASDLVDRLTLGMDRDSYRNKIIAAQEIH